MKKLLIAWVIPFIIPFSFTKTTSQNIVIVCDTLEYLEYTGKEDIWNLIGVYETKGVFLIDTTTNYILQFESMLIHQYEITESNMIDGYLIHEAINEKKKKFKIMFMPDAVFIYEFSFDRDNWLLFRWIITRIDHK
jgi:hypothetical protein